MRQSLRLSSNCGDHFFNSCLNHASQTFLSKATVVICRVQQKILTNLYVLAVYGPESCSYLFNIPELV